MSEKDSQTELLVKIVRLELSLAEKQKDLEEVQQELSKLYKKINYITYILLVGVGANAPVVMPVLLKVFGL